MDFGYARGNIPLYDYLRQKGYTDREIDETKIFATNSKGKKYDRFFNRLIFPIIDLMGRVVAFGGRVLDDSKPKYLNSSETIVYHKSKNLYLMNNVKKEDIDKILIVEGYMDALSLQKNGINFAVASLGTALTLDQARLIKRFTDNVISGYDQDNAGQIATIKNLDILNSVGIKTKVLKLDKKDIKDADEYVNKLGVEKFKNCLEKSVPRVEYKIEILEKKYTNLDDLNNKVRFLNDIASVISSLNNSIERDIYIDRISQKYTISKSAIINEINKIGKKSQVNIDVMDLNQAMTKKEQASPFRTKQERYLMAIYISKDKELIKFVTENRDIFEFKDEKLKKLYEYLLQFEDKNVTMKSDLLENITDESLLQTLTDVMCIDLTLIDKNKLMLDVKKYFKKEKFIERRNEIISRLNEKNINDDEKDILNTELSQIFVELGKLK